MNETHAAIERVADKRHARMCQVMPEQDAALHTVDWLVRMERARIDNPSDVHFIRALKAGYAAKLDLGIFNH